MELCRQKNTYFQINGLFASHNCVRLRFTAVTYKSMRPCKYSSSLFCLQLIRLIVKWNFKLNSHYCYKLRLLTKFETFVTNKVNFVFSLCRALFCSQLRQSTTLYSQPQRFVVAYLLVGFSFSQKSFTRKLFCEFLSIGYPVTV